MYQVEERDKLESFSFKVLDGEIIRYETVWAYSEEEAMRKVEEQGLEILD